uniref:Uncharacterized protein n=1 Tax=viral metagenome TaxID=1070528 RepID=A0A6M3KBF4_9ZZZZ
MRTILLNSTYYRLSPGSMIDQRAINPFIGKLGGAGSPTYSDFSQASAEEYFDFRNGIGKKRGIASESRLDWSEGLDFTTEGQAVLGPLVTTAGAFGVAPVKIIDFQSGTYAIGNSQISKWNTGTSSWDSKDTSLASPLDAIVITDSTDEYLIVSSALYSIYTVDGATWNDLVEWNSPTGFVDGSAGWTNEANAYDENTGTYATCLAADNGKYLELTIAAIFCDRVRVYAQDVNGGPNDPDVAIDLYYDGAWTNIYTGTITKNTWVTKKNPAGAKIVTSMRIKTNSVTGAQVQLHEVDFGATFAGYLADYDNKLFSITTDGRVVAYSAAKNIDDYSDYFELTGNFGTLYELFEGKLLSDGTPTLYFTGTEGLYTIDTTTEIAYKQEVQYPNLTYAGHAGLYWNANVWVATGYGILKVAPSVATYIGPDLDDGLPSGYHGYIYDMETVNNWLVYCVNGGTTDKSSIMKRNSSYGGNQQVYTTSAANKPIACLYHSPSSLYTNGRLWFGEDTDVKYMMFPDITSNVKQIATYQYVDDSSYGTFPIFRKMAGIPKTALRVAAITKSCSATDYVQVFYGLNGAAATTSLGTFISSPKPTTLTFNSGLGTTFYTIQFAIKIIRGTTNTNSAELESLIFYYYPTPTRINSWTMNILATGTEGNRIFTEFETILDTNTLVAFYPSGDSSKTAYYVKLTQMPSRSYWEEQGAREGYFTVVVQEISKD